MAISPRGTPTTTGAAGAVTGVTVPVPTGLTATDISILTVEIKGSSTTAPTITTPAGWTLIGTVTNNGVLAGAADTGSNTVGMYFQVGNTYSAPTITTTNASSMGAGITAYQTSTGDNWDVSSTTTGSDTTSAANGSITGAANLSVTTDDLVIVGVGVSGDIGTVTGETLTATGATFGTRGDRIDLAITTGNDSRLVVVDWPITAGTSTAAPVFAYTNASATTSHARFVRLREVAPPSPDDLAIVDSATQVYETDVATGPVTAHVIPRPTAGGALVEGQLIFAQITYNGDAVTTELARTLPADWTLLARLIQVASPNSVQGDVLYHFITAAEAASPPAGWTITSATALESSIVVNRIQNVDPDTPIAVAAPGYSSEVATSTTTKVGPAVVTTADNSMLITGSALRSSTQLITSVTPGYTIGPSTYGGGARPAALATKMQPTAGTSTIATWNHPSAFGGWGWQSALMQAPIGVAGTTVNPDAVADTSAIFAPAVSSDLTASPGAVADTSVVRTPTVSAAVTVSPALIASAPAPAAPAVSSAVTVAPAPVTDTSALFAPSVAGAVTVSPGLITSAPVLFAPVVSAPVPSLDVTPTPVPDAATLHAPALTSAVTVAPALITSAPAAAAPAITAVITLAPVPIPDSSAVQAPVITPGAVTVSPGITGAAPTVHTPAVAAATTASPGTVTSTPALFAPTLSIGQPGVSPTLNARWVGQPETDGGRMTVNTTSATSVRMAVSLTSNMSSPVYGSPVTPNAQGDVPLTVTGLPSSSAGTTYFVRAAMTNAQGGEFLDTDANIASFKTVPTGRAGISICAASCMNADSDVGTAWLGRGDDLQVILGDPYYADGTGTTLANFRSRFDTFIRYPLMGEAIGTRPTDYTPSDHDGMNNGSSAGTDSAAWALWNQVYREKVSSPPLPANGVYRHRAWGTAIRLVLLDARSFRSNPANTDNSSKTMLGATQKQWLKDLITNNAEEVFVLFQDVPWIGSAVAGEDDWRGYTTERTELANFFIASGKNIAMFAGDMHALAYADGTSSPGGVVLYHCAPLNRTASQKGGPYTVGPIPASGTTVSQQYGRLVITPGAAGTMTAVFTGYSSANAQLLAPQTATFTTAVPSATTVSPGLITSTPAALAPSVAPSITVSPPLLAAPSSVDAPSVSTAVTVAPSLVASTPAAAAPDVTSAITLTPGLITSTPALFAPSAAATVQLSPGLVTSAPILLAPVVTTAVAIAPAPVGDSSAVPAPAVTSSVTASPGLITSAPVAFAPDVVATSSASPTPVPDLSAVHAPAVATAVAVTPGVAGGAAVLHLPTVVAGADVSPAPIVSTPIVHVPAVTGGPVTVAPGLIASAPAALAPTVTAGAAVTPTPIDSGPVAHPPTLGGSVTVAPDPAGAPPTAHPPAVLTGVVAIPGHIASPSTVLAPTLSGATTVSPAPVGDNSAVEPPAVSSSVTVSPGLISSSPVLFGPALTLGAPTLRPDPIVATAAALAPLVSTSVTVSPTPIGDGSAAHTVVVVPTITLSPAPIGGAPASYPPAVTSVAVVRPDLIAATAIVYQPSSTGGDRPGRDLTIVSAGLRPRTVGGVLNPRRVSGTITPRTEGGP